MSGKSSSRAKTRALHRHQPTLDGFFAQFLDPIDWLSQAIYSILMLLTFTLAFRLIFFGSGEMGRVTWEQTNEVLIAAVGATVAWGLIDSVMYVMLSVFERNEKQRLLEQIQTADTEKEGIEAIAAELDYALEPITNDEKRQAIYRLILGHLRDSHPQPVGLKGEDLVGGFASFLVTVVAVLPSLAPFILLRGNPFLALRASNLISFIMLFTCGYVWGKHTRAPSWKTGLLVMLVGAVLALIAIPLGG